MKMKKILNICLAAAVVCAAEGVSARTVSLSAPAEAPQPAAREAAAPMPADNTRMAKPGKKTKAQTPRRTVPPKPNVCSVRKPWNRRSPASRAC